MTNLFDELSAQLVGEYLRNVRGRHLPLGVFLARPRPVRGRRPCAAEGLGLYQGAAAAALLNWREACSPSCGCAEY